MLKSRSYELRLPADWPPASVTVNGVTVKRGDATGKGGWSFEGNTLTTVIPVASASVESKITIEIRRTIGLTARRDDLDGFAGAMTRLRGAYDALQKTSPVASPPDPLIDAMQTGDRLGYHPEKATGEIEHFRAVLPEAEDAVNAIQRDFAQRMDAFAKRLSRDAQRSSDLENQKKIRVDALARAQRLVEEASK
jgi:alpha-glucosidase